MCKQLNKPQVKRLDYNVFVQRGDKAFERLILWSPAQDPGCQAAFGSPEGFHKMNAEFSANSRNFVNYKGPLFKSPELDNYQLLQAFPASKAATQLPSEISKLLGSSQKKFLGLFPQTDAPFIGACPP
jgi:hypothetical protein